MNRIGRMVRKVSSELRALQLLETLPETAAADFGVTRAELCEAARQRGDVPERMQRMSAVFGAELAFREADRYHVLDMARACTCCSSRRDCARVLYDAARAGADDASFCPNAAEYRAMAGATRDPRATGG